MSRRVLIAYDGTPQADRAVEFAANHLVHDELVLLMVLDPMEGFLDTFGHGSAQYEAWHTMAEDTAMDQLERARSKVEDITEVSVDTVVGQVPRQIINYAEEHDIEHIVVGSHGREGVSRILLGSVAELVVRRSPMPVTVVR